MSGSTLKADHTIPKPAFGSPCNGCGYCCQQEACKLSVGYLKSTVAPCIALEIEDGRHWCGLVRNPAKYLPVGEEPWKEDVLRIHLSPVFAGMLRLGSGCDADDPIGVPSSNRDHTDA